MHLASKWRRHSCSVNWRPLWRLKGLGWSREDTSNDYHSPKSTNRHFYFPFQINSDCASQTSPFIYCLNREREKNIHLRYSFRYQVPALSGFTLFLIVDGSHVKLMTDFPESVFLVSAECSLYGKTLHRTQMTNNKFQKCNTEHWLSAFCPETQ